MHPRTTTLLAVFAAALSLMIAPVARAQEAFYTEAATMPSPGSFVLREFFRYSEHGRNPVNGSEETVRYEWLQTLQFGLAPELSFRVDLPIEWRTERYSAAGDDDDKGVSDIDLTLKWRFIRDDKSALDTTRVALLAGAGVASGDDADFSSQSVNPFAGLVLTKIMGRHGLSQDLIYRLNTGGDPEHNYGGKSLDDALRHGTAYLYRLWPAQFAADSHGALYAVLELNGIYETSGDYELLWSPGLMFEARRIAIEFGPQFPLYEDVDERPETDFRIGVGVRFLF